MERAMRCLRSSMVVLLCYPLILLAQTPNATINGRVLDQTRAVIPGATVEAIQIATNIRHATQTNDSGLFAIVDLTPGTYRLEVSKAGFRTIVKPDVVLHVQDVVALNFDMSIGSTSETVTVEGGTPLVNTQDASVSTVIDRNFADGLPMNGRSFQTLIQLTPGVVLTPSNVQDGGQFSINGQRAAANYWTIDGVSANVGASPTGTPGNSFAGAVGGFSALGGTNSLVSVDALEEFRIQTSTYAPEFGRTPGGQISIATRSGTNQFHGTLFDYVRNDDLDANDWFADFARLPKPAERQNDFGGTFSGPVFRDRTFFFFSYEGMRLRLPQARLTTVPDLGARQSATQAMQSYLNAFPLPNGTDNPATGVAQFNSSYSDSSTLDAYSLRVDHRINDKMNVFGRYNYSPSDLSQRGIGGTALSVVRPSHITTQTGTVGTTWFMSPRISNDLRFNYSRTSAQSYNVSTNFGGAQPLSSVNFPAPFTLQNAFLNFDVLGLSNTFLGIGQIADNLQHQVNVVDSVSFQAGPHNMKFGVDYRRLTPVYTPRTYSQFALFLNTTAAKNGKSLFTQLASSENAALIFRNLGLFAQDTWRVAPRLSLTYGLRWDVDFAPASGKGPNFANVTGFDLNNLTSLALGPVGAAPFATKYNNLAPRVGAAYQLSTSQNWAEVIRGGFGVFYDLATSQAGSLITSNTYPFGVAKTVIGGTFPLSTAAAAAPQISPTTGITAFDPSLELPLTLQWNVAADQGLGAHQSLTMSYVGAVGRRLIQTASITAPSPAFARALLITGTGTSDYHGFQAQFQRQMSHGLQVLASYTWSHSIDTSSAGSGQLLSNSVLPSATNANRAASDFDIRHSFSTGLTYQVPRAQLPPVLSAVINHWSLQSVIQARSAPPVDVSESAIFSQFNGVNTDVRPDMVVGQPLYVFGVDCLSALQQVCPGGRGFNPAAFKAPPADPNTGSPSRQGTLPRNALRGFGAAQWDFAIHRNFPIHESLALQFRAEMFNVLNHPNFGPPNGQLGTSNFGLSTQMLGQSLNNGNLGSGAFSPLYQLGGSRSVQLALKLSF